MSTIFLFLLGYCIFLSVGEDNTFDTRTTCSNTSFTGFCLEWKQTGSLKASGSSYSIDTTTTCINVSVDGFCLEWKQTGSFKSSSSCFPSSAVVLRKDGQRIKMEELKLGDHILAYNPTTQQREFTEVLAWLHNDPTLRITYLGIQTQADTLWVSPEHNIAILQNEQIQYQLASEVSINQTIFGSSNEKVESIKKMVQVGAFAPYTHLANFYVGSSSATYLAHSFAFVKNPTLYEYPFFILMWLARIFNVEDTPKGVHPVAQYLQRSIPVLSTPFQKRFSSTILSPTPDYDVSILLTTPSLLAFYYDVLANDSS